MARNDNLSESPVKEGFRSTQIFMDWRLKTGQQDQLPSTAVQFLPFG
jgi:hypothetical protein